MNDFFEWFCKNVGAIFDTWNMFDFYDFTINAVSDEMNTYVNMFHAGMGVRVVRTSNGSLIVAEKNSGIFLRKAEFCE